MAVDFLPLSFVSFRLRFEGWHKYTTTKREVGWGGRFRRAMMTCFPESLNCPFLSGLRPPWTCVNLEYQQQNVEYLGLLRYLPSKMERFSLSYPPCCIKSPRHEASTLQLQISSYLEHRGIIKYYAGFWTSFKSLLNLKGSWNATLDIYSSMIFYHFFLL